MNPRKPTEEEKNEVVKFLLANDYSNDQSERENVEDYIKSAAIAVFDDYVTGYAGKVMALSMTAAQTKQRPTHGIIETEKSEEMLLSIKHRVHFLSI